MQKIYRLNIIKKQKRERLEKRAHQRYQDLSEEEEEEKNQEYGRERYINFPKDEQQRFVKYRKKYFEILKK